MASLPIIVGFGGINSAGRSSCHQAYRRLVIDRLDAATGRATVHSLAALMGLVRRGKSGWENGSGQPVELDSYLDTIREAVLSGTLIRRLESNLFEPDKIPVHRRASLSGSEGGPLEFELHRKQLPDPLPAGWQVTTLPDDARKVRVRLPDDLAVLLNCYRKSEVNAAGQLPSGFDPGLLYPSRNHPRALQLTVFGASDALGSLGIDWQTVRNKVAADQIAVYAGSAFGQLDYNGFGGLLKARLLGKKPTSKQLPLGFAEMPADFVNAYILGSVGSNGTSVAACATFLYNLRQAVADIQSGSHRVCVVGTSEAPLEHEIFEGFTAMGALADDNRLRALDGLTGSEPPDFRRACRPFSNNAGFTMAEASQFVVLFDDELALELGANIQGAVNEVFISADGFKKSIAGPGIGNYLTMAKAVAATRNILGAENLGHKTYVQAHGTGTPQNRTTESHILSRVADTFDIENWPVTAVKSYLGHSIASAAGDQLMASLGIWQDGIVPGITSIDSVADDVTTARLDILMQHREIDPQTLEAVIINSKGFGGNNASASILSPGKTRSMLASKHGKRAMTALSQRQQQTLEKIHAYDQAACTGMMRNTYRFGENVLESADIEMSTGEIRIDGLDVPINTQVPNNYSDYC